MIKRGTIRSIKFALMVSRIAKPIGVNSELEDGNHILMWDFDDVPLEKVEFSLGVVSTRFMLSDIYILRTKEPDNYIAYCFSSFDWRQAVNIVIQTVYVDWQFVRFGVFRNKFTLRVTAKSGDHPYLVKRLEGKVLATAKPEDLK